MNCPFCEAIERLGKEPPALMFAGGIGLGVLMAMHPTKAVPVCAAHLPFARQLIADMSSALNFVPKGGA